MSIPPCPVCEEPDLKTESPGVLVCGHCHAHIVKGQLRCPACQTLNHIDAQNCSACGEPLTVLERVLSRQGSQSRSQRLEQMRGRANAIKQEARRSSDIRMAALNEIDQRRIEHEREDLVAQKLRDQRLFRGVAIGLGLFLFIIAAVALVILL